MKFLKFIFYFAFFLLLWESIIDLNPQLSSIIPAPSSIYTSIITNWELLLINTLNTIVISIISIIISIIISYILAIIIDTFNAKFLYKIISILQIIPPIILIPIMVLIFGFSNLNIVVFNLILATFPLLTLIINDFSSINHSQLLWFNLLTKNKFHLYYDLKIPHSVKALHSGLNIVITYSISNTIIAQYFCGQSGLGLILKQCISNYNLSLAFGILTIVIILTILLIKLVNYIYSRSKYAQA